jgi:hypothetical protein
LLALAFGVGLRSWPTHNSYVLPWNQDRLLYHKRSDRLRGFQTISGSLSE